MSKPHELQVVADVRAFHRAGEQPIVAVPTVPPVERRTLRIKLIAEEMGETMEAIANDDLPEIADGIADSIYVLVGTALEYGIDLSAVWAEVQRSNMAKFPVCERCKGTGENQPPRGPELMCFDCNGRGTQLLRRADGKISKPLGWTPPDIAAVLAAQTDVVGHFLCHHCKFITASLSALREHKAAEHEGL